MTDPVAQSAKAAKADPQNGAERKAKAVDPRSNSTATKTAMTRRTARSARRRRRWTRRTARSARRRRWTRSTVDLQHGDERRVVRGESGGPAERREARSEDDRQSGRRPEAEAATAHRGEAPMMRGASKAAPEGSLTPHREFLPCAGRDGVCGRASKPLRTETRRQRRV